MQNVSRRMKSYTTPSLTIVLALALATAMACSGDEGESPDPNQDESDAGVDASVTEDTGNGGGEEDDEDVPASCEATVELASGGGGLESGSDIQHLQYFGFEDLLCAFDPDAGVAFEVDSGLNPISDLSTKEDQTRQPVLARNDDGDLYVDRVLYLADGELRTVSTDGTAETPPVPRTITSVNENAITQGRGRIRIAADLNDPDRGGVGYGFGRIRRLDDDESASGSTGGSHLGGPITDWESGDALGWLVMEEHDGTPTEMSAYKVDLDGEQQGELLIEPTADLRGMGLFSDAQLHDGSWIFSTGHDGDLMGDEERKFFYYDRASASGEYLGSVPTFDSSSDRRNLIRATDGSALYVTGKNLDDMAYLARVDADGVEILDTGEHSDLDRTWPYFVVAGEDHIVWAWVRHGFGDSPLEVRVWNKTESTMETLLERDADEGSLGENIFIGEGHLFLSFSDTGDGSAQAVAVDLETGDETTYEGMEWIGVTSPGDAFVPHGVGQANEYDSHGERTFTQVVGVSEVFMVGPEAVSVVSASDPSTAVELGEVGNHRNLSMTALGFGPHRLLRSGDVLYYADVETQDSLRVVIDDTNGADDTRLRVISGN